MSPKKKYSKVKFNISIDKKLKDKLDKIKAYPKWRDNRSLVIETALENFFENGKNY